MSDPQSAQKPDAIQETGDGAPPATAGMDTEVALDRFENALLQGDLSELTREERKSYYKEVCNSLDLNPLTKPLEYIRMQGDLTLYATKTAAAQLRKNFRVSIIEVEEEQKWGLYIVKAYAETPDGRRDFDEGTVAIKGESGESLANARMKALTKAKRRVTLSICGLGFLDEKEVDDTPGTAPPTASGGTSGKTKDVNAALGVGSESSEDQAPSAATEPDDLECSEDAAVDGGTPLPDGLTGRNFLIGAGIETVDELEEHVAAGTLTDLDGVGEVTAKAARQWLENNRAS